MFSVLRAIAALTACAALCTGPILVPRTTGPLRQECYVWQRSWDPLVTDAVRRQAPEFARVVVLGAEIEWRASGPRVTRPQADLVAAGPAPGIALRIGAFGGPFDSSSDDRSEATQCVTATARALIAAARARGVAPSELQLDFDCATSRLSGFRRWVDAVKVAVHPTPVTFTALPTWLGHADFDALAHAADGYVLQVHSLVRPASPENLSPLCDPARAKRWVQRAATLGVPFRVALPTYGYVAAFRGDGSFLGLSAEGEPRAWPADTRTVDLDTDPSAMAALVRTWTANRPTAMEGLIWYRMPAPGDRRNWGEAALRKVRRGEVPTSSVTTLLEHPSAGLTQVRVRNTGAIDGAAPAAIDVGWREGRLVASDALAGFSCQSSGEHGLRIHRSGNARIAPGTDRVVAWLRLENETEVVVHAVR